MWWMSILAKKMKTPRKKQLNDKKKNAKSQKSAERVPVFTFILPGGRLAPLPPVSYTTVHVPLRLHHGFEEI